MRSTKFLIFLFFLQLSTSLHLASIEEMNQEYNPTTMSILELLYSKSSYGLLSQGGTTAIDRMFRGVSLRNKNIVDIGCGLGGTDVYLAKKHRVTITGLDPLQHVIDRAQQTAAQQSLNQKLTYVCTPNLPYPIADNSFDIAFSKEALLHCAEKKELLKEVFRILKPGGKIIIIDWLFAENAHKTTLEIFNVPTFKLATIKEYVAYLSDAGFTDISTRLENKHYCRYSKQATRRLKKKKASVCSQFGEEKYTDTLEAWTTQYDLFATQELLVALLKASKPFATQPQPQPKSISQSIKNIFSQIPKLFSRKS